MLPDAILSIFRGSVFLEAKQRIGLSSRQHNFMLRRLSKNHEWRIQSTPIPDRGLRFRRAPNQLVLSIRFPDQSNHAEMTNDFVWRGMYLVRLFYSHAGSLAWRVGQRLSNRNFYQHKGEHADGRLN
ncbi:MAG: hypothetical protein P4N60_21355 [Verrucomicrobiae bacterium]|nr:hypothetical protein [Verrucomicrobiae bacterium]